MITYIKLIQHPTVVPSLIGMSLAEFDQLYFEFAEVHAQRLSEATLTCRNKPPLIRT